MATVINNPARSREDTGSGLGVILAVILVLALAVLLFVFGVPALRSTGTTGGSTINVPDTLDVNLNSGAGAGTGDANLEGGMTQ